MTNLKKLLREEWERAKQIDATLRSTNKPIRDQVRKDVRVAVAETGLDGTLHSDSLEELYDLRHQDSTIGQTSERK